MCILGAVRSFIEPLVMDALEKHFFRRLQRTHNVESLVILDQTDVRAPRLFEALERVAPVFVLFLNTSLPQCKHCSRGARALNQFQRFRLCHKQVLAQEATRSLRYEWIVRTRPDILWEAPLPLLSELNTGGVSGRLASVAAPSSLPNAAITRAFQPPPAGIGMPFAGVTPQVGPCRKWGWARETMLDDQFAVVPRCRRRSRSADTLLCCHLMCCHCPCCRCC